MKTNKLNKLVTVGMSVALSLFSFTSCDNLDLGPEDYYGSESYWKNEAHVSGYVDGIHKHLRDAVWQHTMVFGELRGGTFKDGLSSDGMTISNGTIRLQNLDVNNPGVSKFGDIYGRITNCNLFIARVTDATYISEAKKNFYLGQVYGLRAFYYFDLYRVYGGVPLRLTVDVIDGVLDPNQLYMERATPKEVMDQIKADLDKSLEYFGDVNNFDPYSQGKKAYWNKAATECLMGEVYLWTSKVTTGNDVANVSDLAVAKRHLQSVVNNYNLSLQSSFANVFEARNNKANDEIIFAVRFREGEATNSNNVFTYSLGTGQTTRDSYKADGTIWGDPMEIVGSGSQQYEYSLDLYNSFDDEDTRRDATFMASYRYDANNEFKVYGTHVQKNIGYVNSTGTRIYCGDYVLYRLSWVYLTLAEIANMEDDNASVANYINLVRERAYATNWNQSTFGYSAGDFTQNELAILAEKDKEFIQEGQRWWDLRRMTLTKGGKHLVFCKEGSLNGQTPILNESTQGFKVLWPIDQALLNNDPALKQTPGY